MSKKSTQTDSGEQIDPTGRGEITPSDAISEVERAGELVLRCTLPNGLRVDHKPLPLRGVDGTLWVMFHERDKRGRTGPKQGVINMARKCEPDVQLLHESVSLFAEGMDDDS